MGMIALMVSAEAVFVLPFVLPRVFRPTMLDVFAMTNTELGDAFSAYGLVALCSYGVGGLLADRFEARKLMAAALLATGLVGLGLLGKPSVPVLTALYAAWGFTTVLMYWAALIKATREWGGGDGQGRAFGILDGGRGLLAAVLSSVAVWAFAEMLPVDAEVATAADKAVAFRGVTIALIGFVFVAAGVVWVGMRSEKPQQTDSPKTDSPTATQGSWEQLSSVARRPEVWLQAGIVVCAYVAFKGSDDFTLLARDGFGMDDVEAASLGSLSFWVRPVAALGAGLLADKIDGGRVILVCFAALVVGDLVIWSGVLPSSSTMALYMAVLGTSVFFYALRGVYFALFEEARLPISLTGTAVGLVSVLGYTPDVFFGPLMGRLTDSAPGMLGHQRLFGVLALFAVAGGLCTVGFMVRVQRIKSAPPA